MSRSGHKKYDIGRIGLGLIPLMILVKLTGCHSDPAGTGTPAATVKDEIFTAGCDGTQQRYMMILPAGFDPGECHDVLIALHGHGSDRRQFVKDPRDECRAARDTAAEHRMIFVSADYRASTSWMGPKAEADLVDIISVLRKNYKTGRIFLCGASMGGASSLTFTALHPDLIDGVAALNGIANHLEYENFQDAIKKSFGGTKKEIPGEYRKRSAEFSADSFTMPVGLTTGGRDTSTPPAGVGRLAEAIRKHNPHILLINRPDQGHCTGYDDARKILEFIIGNAGSGRETKP